MPHTTPEQLLIMESVSAARFAPRAKNSASLHPTNFANTINAAHYPWAIIHYGKRLCGPGRAPGQKLRFATPNLRRQHHQCRTLSLRTNPEHLLIMETASAARVALRASRLCQLTSLLNTTNRAKPFYLWGLSRGSATRFPLRTTARLGLEHSP